MNSYLLDIFQYRVIMILEKLCKKKEIRPLLLHMLNPAAKAEYLFEE